MQPQSRWLEGGGYSTIHVHIQILRSTGLPTLNVQSGVIAEDAAFVTMTGATASGAGRSTITVLPTAANPLLRFIRWSITGVSGDWDITFRIDIVLKNQ